MPNQPKPLSALSKPLCARAFLSLWGGRGNNVISKKNKNKNKKKDEDASALPDLFGSLYLDALTGVLKRSLAFPLCRSTHYFAFRCIVKKKNHTREMQLLRRFTVGNGRTRYHFPAELYLLLMMD